MLKIPIIYDKQFIMRPLVEDDYFDYYLIGMSFETTKYLTWGPFKSQFEAKLMLDEFYINRPKNEGPAFAIEMIKTKELAGIIELHSFSAEANQAEIGFVLRQDYQKRGIMTKALYYLLEIAFDYLNLDKVIVGHVDINLDSKRLIEKFPFRYDFTKYASFVTKDSHEMRNIIYYSLYKYEYERSK